MAITASEFKEAFFKFDTWGEGRELVKRMSDEDLANVHNALNIVDDWTELDMRSVWYMRQMEFEIERRREARKLDERARDAYEAKHDL